VSDSTSSSRAEAWLAAGEHFSWSPPGEAAAPVRIFHVELGDPGAPVLVLVHGFPTCSVDWFEVADRLRDRYRVCALDFPGYGFSDKPRGWGYSPGATPSCWTTTWRRSSRRSRP
jgi:pimeloyl-ACP methyl ester carboxylesterase